MTRPGPPWPPRAPGSAVPPAAPGSPSPAGPFGPAMLPPGLVPPGARVVWVPMRPTGGPALTAVRRDRRAVGWGATLLCCAGAGGLIGFLLASILDAPVVRAVGIAVVVMCAGVLLVRLTSRQRHESAPEPAPAPARRRDLAGPWEIEGWAALWHDQPGPSLEQARGWLRETADALLLERDIAPRSAQAQKILGEKDFRQLYPPGAARTGLPDDGAPDDRETLPRLARAVLELADVQVISSVPAGPEPPPPPAGPAEPSDERTHR